MSRRRGPGRNEVAPGVAHVYEGPEVLTALLAKAGSPHSADEVAATFQRAQAAGEPRSAVIPAIFPAEPRFGSPDDARRLYGNLFGLWDRLHAGLGAHDDAPDVVAEPPPAPPLPERGTLAGNTLPWEFVDAVWRNLAAAPLRESQRRRDRFVNAQPDLVAFLETVPLPEAGSLVANDLAFEAWVMFDQAFGERLRTVEYRELRALEKEPPPLETVQPGFAAYAAEQLDVLADEDAAFDAAARGQVEKAIAAMVAGLTGAVQEPS
jgi:hypothetical protein